jgi:general secretion pathway protein M
MGGSLKTPLLKHPLLNSPIPVSKSRLYALGLLFAVVAVCYLAIVGPLFRIGHDYRETVDDLQFRLQRLQRTAAEKETLMQRLKSIQAEGQNDQRFLAKNTAALASAELQTLIKDAVSAAGGELTSTQVIPERTEENFRRIAVKVRMNGGTGVLREVLYNFEASEPYRFIENLNIRPIRIPRYPGAKNPQIPDRLSVDFDVVGYMRSE